jgi:hypothetical protein
MPVFYLRTLHPLDFTQPLAHITLNPRVPPPTHTHSLSLVSGPAGGAGVLAEDPDGLVQSGGARHRRVGHGAGRLPRKGEGQARHAGSGRSKQK